VQVDEGPWETAELAEVTSTDTWRQWRHLWPATSGTHQIKVRATDAAGNLQVADEAPPAPNGSTGYHQISAKVR
jgi:hypothetical protein